MNSAPTSSRIALSPQSKDELAFLIGEWRRQPITIALVNHLKLARETALAEAVSARRDPTISSVRLERACLLGEIIDTLNAGTFIK